MTAVLGIPVKPVEEQISSGYIDVPVHYFRSDGLWGYRIDNPSILGGGLPTHAAAVLSAVDALERALRRDDARQPGDAVVGHIVVQLRAVC